MQTSTRTPLGTVLLIVSCFCVLTGPLALAQTTDPAATTDTQPVSVEATDLFPDLPVGSQYYIGVKYLKDHGLIQGYPDGTFKPSQQINRAEALKILVGAIKFGSLSPAEKPLASLEATPDVSATKCPFPDLDPNAWYFHYVCEAYQNGVVSGYPDGTFKPEQTINKVEALKMDILQGGISTQTAYTDNFDDISPSDWFWDYARIADQKSFIVSDRQGNLNPAETLNRGDFSLLVYRTLRAMQNNSEFGRATFYGGRFDGQGTANGETFSTSQLTAAHKTLPFNTIVRVTNLANGKQVDVRINDRGPYVNGTIIDLSTSAFQAIASLSTGVIHSEVEIITPAP
jgi:hypothetical protein